MQVIPVSVEIIDVSDFVKLLLIVKTTCYNYVAFIFLSSCLTQIFKSYVVGQFQYCILLYVVLVYEEDQSQWGRVATGSDCSGEQSSDIFGSLAHNFFQSGDFANLQKERESALNFQSSTYHSCPFAPIFHVHKLGMWKIGNLMLILALFVDLQNPHFERSYGKNLIFFVLFYSFLRTEGFELFNNDDVTMAVKDVEEKNSFTEEAAVPVGNGQLKQRKNSFYYEKICINEKITHFLFFASFENLASLLDSFNFNLHTLICTDIMAIKTENLVIAEETQTEWSKCEDGIQHRRRDCREKKNCGLERTMVVKCMLYNTFQVKSSFNCSYYLFSHIKKKIIYIYIYQSEVCDIRKSEKFVLNLNIKQCTIKSVSHSVPYPRF
uniref:Transmembrane protein n=1 Tax=Heterorhabditis bacteriophora TaxID=37862 RepID=A0A1I7WGJ3_HETBA